MSKVCHTPVVQHLLIPDLLSSSSCPGSSANSHLGNSLFHRFLTVGLLTPTILKLSLATDVLLIGVPVKHPKYGRGKIQGFRTRNAYDFKRRDLHIFLAELIFRRYMKLELCPQRRSEPYDELSAA